MGKLGSLVQNLSAKQSELLHLRATRIAALNSVIAILMAKDMDTLILTDVSGKIFDASAGYYSRAKKESVTTKSSISLLIPDTDIAKAISHMESQKSGWEDPEKKNFRCTPVFDREGNLQFCIWEIESNSLSAMTQNAVKSVKTGLSAASGLTGLPGKVFKNIRDRFGKRKENSR
jgi:hypothetical protein